MDLLVVIVNDDDDDKEGHSILFTIVLFNLLNLLTRMFWSLWEWYSITNNISRKLHINNYFHYENLTWDVLFIVHCFSQAVTEKDILE